MIHPLDKLFNLRVDLFLNQAKYNVGLIRHDEYVERKHEINKTVELVKAELLLLEYNRMKGVSDAKPETNP